MANSRIKGLTIELGADTSEFVRALANVDKAINETKGNLRDIDKALQLDPSNIELLKDKQLELANQVKDAEEKLELEKEALEAMKNTEGFDANSKAAKNLKTQIDLDEAALKQLKKESKDASNVMKNQFEAIGGAVKEVGNKIKDVGDKLTSIGKNVTTTVTVPIVGAFTAAVKTTADFDAQMSKVQAISGATGDEFDQLREKARELGASTKYSATEAAEGLEYMGMAGWKTDDMLEGLPAILNLAAASGEELGTTSDIVTDALTAFGLGAEDAGRFADILAAAATNANTNVTMMGESFKYVAPVAGSLGYSAEDVAVALGLMANSGIKADMAGTSLRNMFQRMAKPTKESQAALDRLGLSLQDDEGNMYSFGEIMDQMRESFKEINMSAEDYDAALDELDAALADGTLTQSKYDKELEELNKQAFGAEGAEKARAAAMLGGTRAMSGLLAIVNTSEEDYRALNDAIYQSSDAFARLADGSVVPLNEALQSGEEILETYNGQAEAMAATMQDNLTGDITTLKSMLEELAISFGDLLMPLIREVVEKIKEIVDWLNSLDESQKETILKIAAVAAAVGPLIMVIGSVISTIGTVITIIGTLLPILMGPVGIIALIVAAVVALGVAIYKNWDEIKAWAEGVWKAVKEMADKFVSKVKEIKDNVVSKFNEIKQKIVDSVTNAKNLALAVFNLLKNGISEKVTNIKENIVSGFQKAIDWIKNLPKEAWNWGADIINGIVDGIKDKISGVVDAVSGIAETIAEYLHFSEPDIGPLKNFHTFMPDMVKEMISGIKQGIPQLENAVDGMASTLSPQGMIGNTTAQNVNATNTVHITVNAGNMDAGELANKLTDVIQNNINAQIYRQGAAWS